MKHDPPPLPEHPEVERTDCPVLVSLNVLSRKWTGVLLRDMVLRKCTRFSHFLHYNPTMTPRILSKRLRDLQAEGFIERHEDADGPFYKLTAKGRGTRVIILALYHFSCLYESEQVFRDGKPRTLPEVLPAYTPERLAKLFADADPSIR